MMKKKVLGPQETKKEFVKSIHTWLLKTLDKNGHSEYKENFVLDGSSIMCNVPSCYFADLEIPEGIKIEMKFVVKKN